MRVQLAVERGIPMWPMWLLLIGIPIVLPFVGVSDLQARLLAMVPMLVVFAIFTGIREHRLSGTITLTLLSAGYCPCCAFCLDGQSVEPDGCVQCPECAGAWLHKYIGKTEHVQRGEWIKGRSATPSGPDDRGRLVWLMDARLRGVRPADRKSLGAARVAIMRRRVREAGWRRRWLEASAWLALGVSVQTVPLFSPGPVQPTGYAILTGFTALMLLTAVLCVRSVQGIPDDRPARLLVGLGRCGSCAARLKVAEAAPDGCCTCGCGAAWRLR